MSFAEMVVLGTTIGVAHSFEADHVAAVASLVDEESTGRAGVIGTSWGVGHAIPIAAVGVLFLVAGARLPERVSSVAELLAAAVLVVLGARLALSAVETTRHTHDGHTHTHLSVGSLDVGSSHSHREGESFLVGILHGLAGSGLAVGGLAAGASLPEGASLLGAFAVASILTMAALALLWGTVLSRTASRAVQAAAGLAAIAIGLLLLGSELLGVGGMGHDHDGHGHDHGPGGHDHATVEQFLGALVEQSVAAIDAVLALAPEPAVVATDGLVVVGTHSIGVVLVLLVSVR